MRGYWDIERSTSHCVSFVEAEEVDEELRELVARVRQSGFRIAYIDCSRFKGRPWEILSEIGVQLKTDHPPSHADQFFTEHRREMTELLEAFLVQVDHWLEQKVPCHLCFQMSPHPLVAKLFGDP